MLKSQGRSEIEYVFRYTIDPQPVVAYYGVQHRVERAVVKVSWQEDVGPDEPEWCLDVNLWGTALRADGKADARKKPGTSLIYDHEVAQAVKAEFLAEHPEFEKANV